MNNRIKKLYLVDENQIRSGIIPEAAAEGAVVAPTSISGSSSIMDSGGGLITGDNNINNDSGITGGAARNALKDQRQAILQNPLSDPLEKEVWLLDEKVKKVLHNKTMPAWLKLREYLRAIRKFIRMRDLLLRRESEKTDEERAPVIIRKYLDTKETETQEPERVTKQIGTDRPYFPVSEAVQQTSWQPQVQLDPSSVFQFDVNYYSPKNIMQGVSPRLKPRFQKLLESLTAARNFDWDEKTGVIIVNGHPREGTNIKELILHRLKTELGDVPGDSPHRYHSFHKFLKEHGIGTTIATRSQRRVELMKTPPGIKATRPRDESEKPLKRKKVQQRKKSAAAAASLQEEEEEDTDDEEEEFQDSFSNLAAESPSGRGPKIIKLVRY